MTTEVHYELCDITDSDAIEELFRKYQNTRFPLRGLVTCHGLSAGGASIDFPLSTVRKLLEVNFTGTYACAQAAARAFAHRAVAGSIVLVASMSAHGSNRVSFWFENISLI